jgi:hypothetical protein
MKTIRIESKVCRLAVLFISLLAAAQASLAAEAFTSSGTLSTIGSDSFTLTAPVTPVPEIFSVRVVDAQGVPVPGLTVSFFTDNEFCVPLQPDCSVPEDVVYGYFSDGTNEVKVLTDANGIATTTQSYTGGYEPGTYNVAVAIWEFDSAANGAFYKNGGIDLVVRYTINQVFSASPTLDGYMSGNWFDPDQSGQGFQLEFTDQNNTVVAIWYAYAPDGSGQPIWIYGQGTYSTDVHSVSMDAAFLTGAQFPPAFRPSDVVQNPWGTLTFALTDCNHGTASWNSNLPPFRSGSMPITRLTSIKGAACPQ